MDHAMENLPPPCEDAGRRRWLIAATVTGGIGGIATIVPFVESFAHRKKRGAEGAAVSVDLGRLARGEMMTVAWRGMPVFVANRTDEMMAGVLAANTGISPAMQP